MVTLTQTDKIKIIKKNISAAIFIYYQNLYMKHTTQYVA